MGTMAAYTVLRKILYLVFFAPVHVSFEVLKQIITGLHSSGRPSQKWSLRQAVMVRLVKTILRSIAYLKLTPRLTMKPGLQGERFIVLPPRPANNYLGPLDDVNVKPQSVGGTWFPELPIRFHAREAKEARRVVLFLHGGAFIIGNGRDPNTGPVNKTLTEKAGCSYVFWPQYRLATTDGERFPAALQDSLSAYLYLIRDMAIPPECIILAGNSAGGNLALGLLRYINEYGSQLNIPQPALLLLFSPWTNIVRGDDGPHVRSLPNFHSDYLHPDFGAWGTKAISGYGKVDRASPYLSPTQGHAYRIEIPIWMHTGGREILFNENTSFVEQFREAGSSIEWLLDETSPHDVMFMGDMLGFKDEVRNVSEHAARFIRRHFEKA